MTVETEDVCNDQEQLRLLIKLAEHIKGFKTREMELSFLPMVQKLAYPPLRATHETKA